MLSDAQATPSLTCTPQHMVSHSFHRSHLLGQMRWRIVSLCRIILSCENFFVDVVSILASLIPWRKLRWHTISLCPHYPDVQRCMHCPSVSRCRYHIHLRGWSQWCGVNLFAPDRSSRTDRVACLQFLSLSFRSSRVIALMWCQSLCQSCATPRIDTRAYCQDLLVLFESPMTVAMTFIHNPCSHEKRHVAWRVKRVVSSGRGTMLCSDHISHYAADLYLIWSVLMRHCGLDVVLHRSGEV